MPKRSLEIPDQEEMLQDEPPYKTLELPPQIPAAVSGLAGFMGMGVRVVAFEQETKSGRRQLTIAIDPRHAKPNCQFAKAIGSGPVAIGKAEESGKLDHFSGEYGFFAACCGHEQIHHTLGKIASTRTRFTLKRIKTRRASDTIKSQPVRRGKNGINLTQNLFNPALHTPGFHIFTKLFIFKSKFGKIIEEEQ